MIACWTCPPDASDSIGVETPCCERDYWVSGIGRGAYQVGKPSQKQREMGGNSTRSVDIDSR
jgi:hypothetical protein